MDTDKLVADKLTAWGIEFSAKYVGETKRENWQCDAWRIKIGAIETDYYTGLGCRKLTPNSKHDPRADYPKKSIGYESFLKDHMRPVHPSAASVINSLLLDSEAENMSFNTWCDVFEYSNDSIKAFNIYQSCCASGNQMRKVFTHAQLDELRELLQGY